MTSSQSGAIVAVSGGGGDVGRGESYHGKSAVDDVSALRGLEVDDASYDRELEEAMNKDKDLTKALTDTSVTADSESGERLMATDAFTSVAGYDEPSLLLVTKKLMENMLRKKPTFTKNSVDVMDKVTAKLQGSKFVERVKNNVNLMASRWDQNKLVVYPIASGQTLDTLVPIEFPRALKIKNVSEAVYRLMTADNVQEELIDNFDLRELQEEKALEVLASGFIKTGADYVDEIIKRSLSGETSSGGNSLKETLLSLRTHAAMVSYVRELGLVKDGDFKAVMQNMLIADLVTVLIDETRKSLETALVSYAIICDLINKREPTNCRLFRFTCVGSALIKARVGSSKNFKLCVDDSGYLSQLIISLRCVENRGRASILRLEVLGDVMLDQRAVVKLYSSLYRSTGIIEATTDEVITIQDDVFESFLTAELIDFVDSNDDYTVTNASGLVPMMVLGGIVPDNLEDPATNICWQISLRSVVNNLCRLNRVFDTSLDRNHFLFNFKTALIIASGLDNVKETKKFIVQFFLWARFVDKISNIVYTDYHVNSLMRNKATKTGSGLGAQCLWMASALLEINEICETGYKYLPIIIFYNLLCSGECSAKLVNMGVWLASSLNLNTDRVIEDKCLLEIMEKMGAPVNIDWKRRLAMQHDIGSKIAITVEMLREKMSHVIPLVNVTSCTKVEAALLCKLALMDLDESDSASDNDTADHVTEISVAVADKMKKSAEQGEMSSEDYLMLIKEMARDMEDDDEVKQVLNTEGTKYHVISEKLFEMKSTVVEASGGWKNANVGEAPSSLRRKEMERQLIKDFTNQTVAFSEKARNTMYQMTDFNSTTMRDTLSLNGAIITSFLHRMGNLGGKDINILLSKMAGKGVEGASASLSADDVNVFSIASVETSESERGKNASSSSTTKLTLLEGISLTVGISQTFDLTKLSEAVNKLTKKKSVSSLKLKHNLECEEVLKLRQSPSSADESGEMVVVPTNVSSNRQIIRAYFSSMKQELEECFEIMTFENDDAAFKNLRKFMLAGAGLPMSLISCVTVVVRRLSDVVWDTTTYLYDEIDETSKEAERSLSVEGSSRSKRATRISIETFKVALSTALISYKVTFTTYFSVAEGLVSLIKRLSVKTARVVYIQIEKRLVFIRFFFGISTDMYSMRKYVEGRHRAMCERVGKEYVSESMEEDGHTEMIALSKAETAACIMTRPVRIVNRLIAGIVNNICVGCSLLYSKLINFYSFSRIKLINSFNYVSSKIDRRIKSMMSHFREASNLIISALTSRSDFEVEQKNKGKGLAVDDSDEDERTPVVSSCGFPETDAARFSSRERGETSGGRNNIVEASVQYSANEHISEYNKMDFNVVEQVERDGRYDEVREQWVSGANAISTRNEAVLRIKIAVENRFVRFVRVTATRALLVTRILLEEWADMIEDVIYLVFTRVGYSDKYNVVRLSMELDPGSLADYERRAAAQERKNSFFFNTYKAVYRFCQYAHEKFVVATECAISPFVYIKEFYKKKMARRVNIIISLIKKTFDLTVRRYYAEDVNAINEVASGTSRLRGSCGAGGHSERRTSSSNATDDLICSRAIRGGASEERLENESDTTYEITGVDEDVNRWLMNQDESCYELHHQDDADEEDMQEAMHECLATSLTKKVNVVKRTALVKEKNKSSAIEMSITTQEHNDAASQTEGTVSMPDGGEGVTINDSIIASVIDELRERISEVVWAHEASNIFKRECEAMHGVNWVLTSVGGSTRKNLLRYVGEENFNKLVVLIGDVNESVLKGIEARLDLIVLRGSDCWRNNGIIKLMTKDIKANFGVTIEFIDEDDVNDKLAEIIAIEFECKIGQAMRRRKKETSSDKRYSAEKSVKIVTTVTSLEEGPPELNRPCDSDAGENDLLMQESSGRKEVEVKVDAEYATAGYVKYGESPMSKMMSRIASFAQVHMTRKYVKIDCAQSDNKFDKAEGESMKGLRLALDHGEESNDSMLDEGKRENREDDEKVNENREACGLTVWMTASEESSGITKELFKLLTSSMKSKAMSYVKSWMNSGDERKDNITVKVIERQGKLSCDDEREIRMRGYASLAPMWESLADVCSSTVDCDAVKEESNAVEIFGRRRLVKHGKKHDDVKYLIKREIDIIDTVDVSLLCLPVNVCTMRENLMSRGKYVKKSGDDYTCTMKAVCDVTAGKSLNKVMRGKSCVVRNESMGVEMLMLPNHLNAYGRSLPDSELVDSLDCLAMVAADSTWLKTPKQLLMDAEIGSEDATASGILARQEFDTSSRYFSIVTVDAVDWRGKSGAPIVDCKGKFLGILLMQITDGPYFNVLNDAGVIICAKPSLSARPIFHSTDVKVAKCVCCRPSDSRPVSRRINYGSSESGSDISGMSATKERLPEQRYSGDAGACHKCVEMNKRGESDHTSSDEPASDEKDQGRKLCQDCAKKRDEDNAYISSVEKGKKILRAGLDYLTGRSSNDYNYKDNVRTVETRQTGALERIGEILAAGKNNRIDAGASDEVVIHNISEILYYSDKLCTDDLTKKILEFILEQLVKGCKPIIVCSTNTCYLTVMLLMSSLRLRFDRVRSVSDLQRVCCLHYRKTRTNVVIASNEDIICSTLSKEKLTLSCQHYKVRCLMLTSDNETVKNCSLASLKILSLFLTNMTVVMYDCKRNVNSTDESAAAMAEKLSCVETKRMDTYQNCGVFHHLQMSNAIIEMAELNGLGSDNDDGEIRNVVITMCSNTKDYVVIKNRLSKVMDVGANSILVTNHGAFASKLIWEVIKTCKNVFLHTGTKATYVNDLIVNCSLDHDMALSEKEMFLEAYRIASKLTIDVEYCNDTVMNVATLKDMNSDTRADKSWFLVDYRSLGTSKSYNSSELVKKTNHTFIEGNTVVQIVSVIENKFKVLRADNEQITMLLADEDLINENLVMKKRSLGALMATFSMKIEEYITNAKWTWYNVTIGTLMFIKKIKNKVLKAFKRCKYVLKAKVLRSVASMRKFGKQLVRTAFSSLRVNKTASYFEHANKGSDSTAMSRFLSSACRCAGLANAAASVMSYKKTRFCDDKRIDNSIIVLMISASFEAISNNLNDGVRIALENIGNVAAMISCIGEVAYLVLGWKKNLIIGNWRLSSCGLSANKVVAIKVNKMLTAIRREIGEIEVVQTGLIIDDVLTDNVDTVTFLNMYELGLSLYEVIRKLWLSLRLSRLFSNLRKGIEYKNDHPFPTQRTLEVVPCYEVGTAVSSVILIGTTGVIAMSLAFRRVETAVSSIAVITEKKHTYDMVEVYKRDRDLGAVLFRTASIGYGFYLLTTRNQLSCAIGAVSLCLGAADLITNSFSELGVCYSLSHILVRMYTARNKIRAAINGWSAWYGGGSTVANGMNALIITGSLSKSDEKTIGKVKISDIKLKMALAQNKERLANGVLMDKSVKAASAYDNAKTIVLGRSSIGDLSDAVKWDHEAGAHAEILDLSLIANRGVGSADWDEVNSTQVMLGELTVNQCRFIGRTQKLLKFDKQMVPDELVERQSSVLALHDDLWRGVVSEADREGWGAAGDSRYAVLLAIAERNDTPIVLNVTDALMEMIVVRGVELIMKIIPGKLKVKSKVKSLDWLTIVSNINERATSGILTRLRTGQQVTAGYLPNYGYRSELLCEMMHDDTMPDECSIINVFAKRRIEKKKNSRLTGVECVITRTIQANEVDLKVACSGSFVMLDKLMKLTKCYNGLAIGLNFFIEFAADDLNTSTECYRRREDVNVRRISLDHSSFDSSQRNWSITLCRELRILANEIMMVNSIREVKEANDLIRKIYDGLMIRLMLTTHGDLFAVTGQQMSGHATTSSDNSVKAYLYAMVACDLMKQAFHCELIADSMRAQGDDTKFDVIINSNEVSDTDIGESISRTMAKLGQAVKIEKIEVRRIGESSSFLSNKCGLVFFLMRRTHDTSLVWYESHLVPARRRRDLIAMLATILKASSGNLKRKTKKNISLLAAKSMSFLTMYVGDALVARTCVAVIWICFKALTEFKYVSSKMDITSTHLPWFVEQSGIQGEFEIKIFNLMSMHGIVRKELEVMPEYWLIDKLDPDYDMIDLPQILLRNAKVAFPAVRDWEENVILNALKLSDVKDNERLMKVSVVSVDEQLNKIKDGLTLSIIEATVPYEPFNRLKRRVKANKTFISSLGLKKIFVISEEGEEEREICYSVLKQIEDPSSTERLNMDVTTKDGLIVRGLDMMIMKCKDYNIGVVNSEIEARLTEVNPWNVINLVCVREANIKLVHDLGKGCCRSKKGGIVVTDLNMLNRHRNNQELEDDLNRSLEGASLERLSKLKLRINEDTKTTTRNLLIAKDKLWWKP